MIDCDEGTISFKRCVSKDSLENELECFLCSNGIDLGIAFENIPCGRGIAYFPAISLSQNERVRINFGAAPFRHPTLNHLPLDEKPQRSIEQAQFLLNIFEQILRLGKSQRFGIPTKTTNTLKVTSFDHSSSSSCLSLVTSTSNNIGCENRCDFDDHNSTDS